MTTINKEEIQKFSDLAEEWWDVKGKFKPLHKFNPIRIKYIKESVIENFKLQNNEKLPLNGINLLDIGCGGGVLSETLSRFGASVVGIDASHAAIEVAGAHSKGDAMTSDIRYICGSVEEFAEAETLSGSPLFDIVCALEIVEHVVEPRTFLKSCAQLVRPGGLLFVSTLNRTPRSMALGVFGAEVVLGLVPAGTHDWAKFVKPVELQEYLEGAGESVKVSDICGLKMSLIDGSWYEDKGDTEVNYIVTASKKASKGKGTNEKEAGQGQGHGQKKKIDAMPDGAATAADRMQEYSAIVQRW